MKVTKHAITWERNFSATGAVVVPAGAPVEFIERDNQYFVQPSFFDDKILRHDAAHYGCRVDPDNVIEISNFSVGKSTLVKQMAEEQGIPYKNFKISDPEVDGAQVK
jgi:hypothetical protein